MIYWSTTTQENCVQAWENIVMPLIFDEQTVETSESWAWLLTESNVA